MSRELGAARARLERLLEATRRAVAPGAARDGLLSRLERTTGLSRANIVAALDECLELEPTQAELEALLGGVVAAPGAHVILPANVFIAAHRALALALAATPHVRVKASRREPAFCEAVHACAPELFELVRELAVAPGEHVFAYGSDVTLGELRRSLPEGAVLHAHGSGFGVAVVALEEDGEGGALDGGAHPAGARAITLEEAARAIARDVALFDQRGCLSPRFVLALGSPRAASALAERLAATLAELERELPVGRLAAAERAEARWWVECAACFGRLWRAGSGFVTLREPGPPGSPGSSAALEVPPVGRHLEILPIAHLGPAIDAFASSLTSVGCSDGTLARQLAARAPHARVTSLGRMQRPAFDGPVDRRSGPHGEQIAAIPRTSR